MSITTDGIHTVKYWSTDKAGNTEGQHTLTVDVDRTAPGECPDHFSGQPGHRERRDAQPLLYGV